MATSKKKTAKKKTRGSSLKRRQNKGDVDFGLILSDLLESPIGFVSEKKILNKVEKAHLKCPDPTFGRKGPPLVGKELLAHLQNVVTTAAKVAKKRGVPVSVFWDADRRGFYLV